MKKILTILLITAVILFLFIKIPIKATTKSSYKYAENYNSIKFNNFNSKNLNELFEGINGTVIEIEIETPLFTKAYRFNTSMIDNVEQNLTEKVINDLISIGKRELAVSYKNTGIKIIRIDIRCTNEELEIIKKRSAVK